VEPRRCHEACIDELAQRLAGVEACAGVERSFGRAADRFASPQRVAESEERGKAATAFARR
jgi:hypothetical protein